MFKFLSNGAVRRVELCLFLQDEVDRDDDKNLLQTGFEDGTAVAKFTGLFVELTNFPRLSIDCPKGAEDLHQLNAVSADVLHGGGANVSRNQAEVFDARPALINAVQDRFMPVLASAKTNNDFILVFFLNLNSLDAIE